MNSRRRKGMVLLQTLVMSVILSMVAVMLMKWVLARYMIAIRTYRSSVSNSHSQGYGVDRASTWNFVNYPNFILIPTNGSVIMDGKTVSYSRTARPIIPTNGMTITIRTDEDQP
jgi:hypothetical protein